MPVPCTHPTGKNTAPAIKKPQEAVLRQVTTCVSQDKMTQPTRTNGSSSLMAVPYLISMSGTIVEGLNTTR